ncbi:MAG: HNH endonuclease signature motif containing protein, partial [Rhodothermia bacterium]
SAETSRRLSCDAGIVRITHEAEGSVMNVGRRTRTVPPALRRALDARDGGCRFPDHSPSASGARGLRFTDAHHVRHWADGGETSLGNCLLLCRHHHRLVHEGGWRVVWWGEGTPAFLDPRGGTHFDGRWKPPELPERPVEALLEQNRRNGAIPDGWTAGARWKREVDIPNEVYLRAVDAIA